jgi:hypothetical protein
MREAGLKKDALYLMRPDTYLALASPEQDTTAMNAFLEKVGLRL